ncbi:MAG: hypothetical protein KAJ01_01865 [Candidatus Hydrogenedentes bacterium]|nr:hypothetical protein [Candidatus Hydrogenedentota bacterium]
MEEVLEEVGRRAEEAMQYAAEQRAKEGQMEGQTERTKPDGIAGAFQRWADSHVWDPRIGGRARITREVKPGIERTEEVWLETEGARHWGIWHPEREEWWWAGVGIVFSTTSRAVALAQLQAARQLSAALDKKRWVVRCIEEWADEQHE